MIIRVMIGAKDLICLLSLTSHCIIPFCKHAVAKVTLFFGKRDKGGHGGGTMNNARTIIEFIYLFKMKICLYVSPFNMK